MKTEGVIKFQCQWKEGMLSDQKTYLAINVWRKKLFDYKLIGTYPDGTCYGNLSTRLEGNGFMITGTSTGSISDLTEQHYCIVTDFDIEKNFLACEGPVKASSESLTHAVIYESLPTVNTIVHIHNEGLWKNLINKAPTTSKEITYGTSELAIEIRKLIRSNTSKFENIIVMGGHKDGIIVYGQNLGRTVDKTVQLLHS